MRLAILATGSSMLLVFELDFWFRIGFFDDLTKKRDLIHPGFVKQYTESMGRKLCWKKHVELIRLNQNN